MIYELAILINSQQWHAEKLKDHTEGWFRANQALFSKFREPLMPRGAIDTNDVTGYQMYPFTSTNTAKGADGNMYEDRRAGSMELFCQLAPGATWPNNYAWMIHGFTRRNFSIDTEGQITKNFL